MKTVLVAYSNRKLSVMEANSKKHYAFNTEAELAEGDMINSPTYDTNMVVVRVLPQPYKYYNMSTGDLSDEFKSTAQRPIRDLIIQESKDEQVVYATKVID